MKIEPSSQYLIILCPKCDKNRVPPPSVYAFYGPIVYNWLICFKITGIHT